MKKTFLEIIDSLKQFWFFNIILHLAIAATLFIAPAPRLSYLTENGASLKIASMLWDNFIYFFAPFGLLTIILSIWKNKPTKKQDVIGFWLPIFYVLISLAFFFVNIYLLNDLKYQIELINMRIQ